MKKLSLYIFLVLMWCNVSSASCEGKIDETKFIGDATYVDGTPLKKGERVVSCEGVSMFWSTKQKKYLTEMEYSIENFCLENVKSEGKIIKNTCPELITIDTSKLEGVIKVYPYNGYKTKEPNSLPKYYSIKQKKYLSCKEFKKEGGGIKNPEKKDDFFYGANPTCHGEVVKFDEGDIRIFDARKEIFIPKESLSDKLKNHSTLIIIVSIILIIVFFFIKFGAKTINLIKLLFRKIKSPFKKDWKRIMLTLSILYLCIMYYLNWWGHQGGMFIYKMTYSWFLRWGLIPVVSGWIIYYIWRKEK